MPVTNTLDTARRLESLGFSHQQAQGLAEALESAAGDTRVGLATQEKLEAVEKSLRAEIHQLRTEIRTDMKELELRIGVQVKDMELRIAERLRGQMIWFFAVQAAIVSAAVAILKLW